VFETIRSYKGCGMGFVTVWCSAFMLFADVRLGVGFANTVRSADFVPARATITRSKLRPVKNGVYLELEYTFAVNGRSYTSTRYHGEPQFVGNRYWRQAHATLPTGTTATIYYNPDDPSESAVVPGPRWDQLLVLWCLTPFNVIAFLLVWAAWSRVAGWRGFDPIRDARPIDASWCVRLSGSGALSNALVALLVVTFVGCFVLIGGYDALVGLPPPGWLIVGAWAFALAASLLYAIRQRRRRRLLIDNQAECLTLPASVTAAERTIPFRRITGVTTAMEMRPRGRNETDEMLVCSFNWRDETDTPQSTSIAEYADRRDADALAEWLRERVMPAGSRPPKPAERLDSF
jgi:hypothetical protein